MTRNKGAKADDLTMITVGPDGKLVSRPIESGDGVSAASVLVRSEKMPSLSSEVQDAAVNAQPSRWMVDASRIARAFNSGQATLAEEEEARRAAHPGAAVFIPLLPMADGFEVLFEVRAQHLDRQPGEVCYPGGHIEPGEAGLAAAVRETCEELLVSARQIAVLGTLDCGPGPGGMPLTVCYGVLNGYRGTFSPDEVDRTFRVPLRWFFDHEPRVFHGRLTPRISDEDFPWNQIPQGHDYPWRTRPYDVTFYFGTDPLIWGMTARVMHRFVTVLRRGDGEESQA